MEDRTLIEQGQAALAPMAETLARAFHDDPAFVFMMPDPAIRRARLPSFFRFVIREDLAAGRALHAPDMEVATLWRALGRQKEAPLGPLRTNLTFLSIFRTAIGRAETVGKALAVHHPKGDHWHLRYIGVRPEAQGKGWGGLALRQGLARADADGLPVYLETSKRSNMELYCRFGFDVTEEWDVPEGGPHFWSMLRPA
jgi:GNAT superfamily N-acetyltransferase